MLVMRIVSGRATSKELMEFDGIELVYLSLP